MSYEDRKKTNLKAETLKALNANGKCEDDIVWIGTREAKISSDRFWELADVVYDAGYGAPKVAEDLIIVGDGWWLERQEYDGSEWWEYKEPPKEPTKTREVKRLITRKIGWDSLADIQEG